MNDNSPVHFIGIAGAGMSALAELYASRGITVTGSDTNTMGAPDLLGLGISVLPHDAANVAHARAVVYSSAIPTDHPEMAAARAAGIPLIRRAEALGEAVNDGVVVGIAGTHGKTTTTVMTTDVLASGSLDPVGIAGGRVGRWNGNLRRGRGGGAGDRLFVVEADEYDRSFLALRCTVAVVLNVEEDHLDIYRDLSDIERAFEEFVAPAGTVVRCADDPGAMKLRLNSPAREITYSTSTESGAQLTARDIIPQNGGSGFEVYYEDRPLGAVTLRVPGIHNVRNALAAAASGIALNVPFPRIAAGLAEFTGVERRFQLAGVSRGITVVDDYAHHPTEVAATIAAARMAYPGARLVAAFQPHLYSRTRDLSDQFASALSAADAVFLCDIYGAREAPIAGVTSELIAKGIPTEKLRWMGGRSALAAALLAEIHEGDLVLLMGAGDITKTADELMQGLEG